LPSTPKINTYVTNASDVRVSILKFHPTIGTPTPALSLRLYNGEVSQGTTANLLFAIRADLLREAPAWEETEESNANGTELMTESWLEISTDGGSTWAGIDEYASGGVDLGAVAAGAYAAFHARVNTPAGASTLGECNFALVVRSRP